MGRRSADFDTWPDSISLAAPPSSSWHGSHGPCVCYWRLNIHGGTDPKKWPFTWWRMTWEEPAGVSGNKLLFFLLPPPGNAQFLPPPPCAAHLPSTLSIGRSEAAVNLSYRLGRQKRFWMVELVELDPKWIVRCFIYLAVRKKRNFISNALYCSGLIGWD